MSDEARVGRQTVGSSWYVRCAGSGFTVNRSPRGMSPAKHRCALGWCSYGSMHFIEYIYIYVYIHIYIHIYIYIYIYI